MSSAASKPEEGTPAKEICTRHKKWWLDHTQEELDEDIAAGHKQFEEAGYDWDYNVKYREKPMLAEEEEGRWDVPSEPPSQPSGRYPAQPERIYLSDEQGEIIHKHADEGCKICDIAWARLKGLVDPEDPHEGFYYNAEDVMDNPEMVAHITELLQGGEAQMVDLTEEGFTDEELGVIHDEQGSACPNCGSTFIRPFTRYKDMCTECGHEWAIPKAQVMGMREEQFDQSQNFPRFPEGGSVNTIQQTDETKGNALDFPNHLFQEEEKKCPECKEPLTWDESESEWRCYNCGWISIKKEEKERIYWCGDCGSLYDKKPELNTHLGQTGHKDSQEGTMEKYEQDLGLYVELVQKYLDSQYDEAYERTKRVQDPIHYYDEKTNEWVWTEPLQTREDWAAEMAWEEANAQEEVGVIRNEQDDIAKPIVSEVGDFYTHKTDLHTAGPASIHPMQTDYGYKEEEYPSGRPQDKGNPFNSPMIYREEPEVVPDEVWQELGKTVGFDPDAKADLRIDLDPSSKNAAFGDSFTVKSLSSKGQAFLQEEGIPEGAILDDMKIETLVNRAFEHDLIIEDPLEGTFASAREIEDRAS